MLLQTVRQALRDRARRTSGIALLALGFVLAATGGGDTAAARNDSIALTSAHARREIKTKRNQAPAAARAQRVGIGAARKVASAWRPQQESSGSHPFPASTSTPNSTPWNPASSSETKESTLTPEPVSESDPETAPDTPIFNGRHPGDFWLLQGAPDSITDAPDPAGSEDTVLKFTVNNQDVYPITPTKNPRAQALSPRFIEEGMEVWTSFSFFLPESFPDSFHSPTVWNGTWVQLYEIYGPPFAGDGPVGISIRPFKGKGLGIGWQRNHTYGTDNPWVMPLKKSQWITVLTHERFATDGWVEMWVNGQQITFFEPEGFDYYNPNHEAPTQRLEMATMDSSNDEGSNYAKISNYREVGMFESGTVYFSGLEVGETRASVGG